MPTSSVITVQSGTGFSINVTACNLLTDLGIKDFLVLHNGTPVGLANYTKVSATVVQYTGASIGTTTVEIRRNTPTSNIIISQPGFLSRLSSQDYIRQLDRFLRKWEEGDLYGFGPGSIVVSPAPLNDPFGVAWNGDSFFSATRNALYNYLITLATLANPTFTGNVLVPDLTDLSGNSRAANSRYVDTRVANAFASSPSLGGTPTSITPPLGDSSTRIATTAFVKQNTPPELQEFRLSASSTDPNPASDISSTSTIYLLPYTGNKIALYESSVWVPYSTASIPMPLSGLTTNLPYDVFVYSSGGTLVHEFVAWTNDTTRATGITYQNGIPTKTGDSSRRLVGTFTATGATTTAFNKQNRNICNVNNMLQFPLRTPDVVTVSWTIGGLQYVNNSTSNRVFVTNALEGKQLVSLACVNAATFLSSSAYHLCGIGFRSTTFHVDCMRGYSVLPSAGSEESIMAYLNHQPTVGQNDYRWLESAETASVTGLGNASRVEVGMTGWCNC